MVTVVTGGSVVVTVSDVVVVVVVVVVIDVVAGVDVDVDSVVVTGADVNVAALIVVLDVQAGALGALESSRLTLTWSMRKSTSPRPEHMMPIAISPFVEKN